jgi:hypothetical protein
VRVFCYAQKIFLKAGIAALLSLAVFGCALPRPEFTEPSPQSRIVLLTSEDASPSLERPYSTALGSLGFHLEAVTPADSAQLPLGGIQVLIIPCEIARALDSTFVQKVVREVHRGLCVITEGQSVIVAGLGIPFLKRDLFVDSIADSHHPDIPITWQEQMEVKEIDPKGLNIFCRDRVSGIPVLSGGSLGQGRFLYLGVPLDKSDGWGYSRFPFFHEAVVGFFHLKPYLKRNRLMVYLDWGFHYSENPESLARRLKGYGISEVHLSSWYDVRQCRDFFKQFITACHEEGILVYSWLELPMVTREFWNAHPEWREKTATGEDARVDWRLLMALEIPGCMEAVKSEIKKGINAFDWDGVDEAELYFESPLGVEEPENFTPLSNVVRDDFKSRYGVDPMELFNLQSTHFHKNDRETLDRFFQYRSELCTRLNRELLLFVKEMRQRNTGRPVDVMLTQVDSIIDTAMRDNIAVDPDAFMQLQQELGFTLQVEDPFTLWSRGPDRYRVIGTAYRSRMAEGARLTVDVNIVNRVDTRYPTSKQTGLEFLVLLSEASSHADQVCLYAAHTPNEFDYTYAPYALAGQAHLKKNDRNQYSVSSPYTVLFETETDGKEFLVNGKPWPCVNKMGVILPSGNSVVTETSPSAEAKSRLFITDLTAEIGTCSWSGKSIILRYNDKRNVLVSLNRKSGRVFVNGREEHLPRFSGDGTVTFSCPAGENEVIFFDEEDR